MKTPKTYRITIGTIVSLFVALLASVPRILKADDFALDTLLINIGYTFFLSMFCWVFHHFVVYSRAPWSWMDIAWSKFLLSVSFCVFVSIGYHHLVSKVIHTAPFLLENVAGDRKLLTLIFRGSLISGFMFFVTYYLHLSSLTQQSRIENERLKKEKLHARLESLKQQISPHFLFNTLNTLSTLTKEPRVKEYISQISNVYRYLLKYKDSDTVRVSDELDFIESYLYILRQRFEEGLLVTFDVANSVRNSSLPPLALQTLVENAVKHNIVAVTRPLHITIVDEDDFIVVSNNIQLRQSIGYESSRSGLNNISERYRLLADRDILIEKTETEFTVKLPILR
ncbi:MAG: histidine kinase [Bacteroidetes bacterium]|nr:histidine kinase [Bacteroidota bacterium]